MQIGEEQQGVLLDRVTGGQVTEKVTFLLSSEEVKEHVVELLKNEHAGQREQQVHKALR